MCGRYSLAAQADELRDLFDAPEVNPNLVPPRYNIAPTQPIVIVRSSATGRELIPVRWGLLPHWVKDPKDIPLLINARAEGVDQKASFRNAFKRRRCLIPASGFYEWQKTSERRKQPYWIRPDDEKPVAFAGLWETWHNSEGAEYDTGAIITTQSNQSLKDIHHRMPAILGPDDFQAWLAPDTEPSDLLELLRPAGDNLLRALPVSIRVNAVRNDDAENWTPIDTQADPDDVPEADQDQSSLF